MNLNIQWNMVIVLIALGVFGSAAIIPYSVAMQKGVEMTPRVVVLGLVQGVILAAVSVIIGMLASRSLGLKVTSEAAALPLSALLGAAAGAGVLILEVFIFLPHLPAELTAVGEMGGISLWKRLLASFYGGINEEVMMRFFIMSVFLWLLTKVWHHPSGGPLPAAFWIANILVAVLFGLGHLPALKMLTEITPFLIIRSVALNMIPGLVFGWIFWKYGLAAAMVSHFCADLVLHVISPIVTKIMGTAGAAA